MGDPPEVLPRESFVCELTSKEKTRYLGTQADELRGSITNNKHILVGWTKTCNNMQQN